MIIYQNGTVYPIEIKKGSAPKNAVKNFSVLNPISKEPETDMFSDASHLKTEIGTGAVICLSSDVLPIDKKNWYVPRGRYSFNYKLHSFAQGLSFKVTLIKN